MRREHLILLLLAQAGEQRQHLDTGRVVLAQLLGGVADLALARQEDEDVAAACRGKCAGPAPQFVHCVADRVAEVMVTAFHERPPADLDRIEAS